MRRGILTLAIAAGLMSAAAVGPAGAGVKTESTLARGAFSTWYEPNANGYTSGVFSLWQIADVDSDGTTVTPAGSFMGQAQLATVTFTPSYTFTTVDFDAQLVSPTALNMDPIGNTARLSACLTPRGGGACQSFDVSLSRPQYFQIGTACTNPSNFGCANGWFDPATNSASASTFQSIGMNRFNYAAQGTVPTGSLPTQASGNTFFSLYTVQTATAP